MKTLNNQYQGTTWSNGKFPKPIKFDDLTDAHIPFLEKMGFGFLVIEVCDECQHQECVCNIQDEGEEIETPKKGRKKKDEAK